METRKQILKGMYDFIKELPEQGLKYQYLQLSLSDYHAAQQVFNELNKTGMSSCMLTNVIALYALKGFITCQTGVNWLIKIPSY